MNFWEILAGTVVAMLALGILGVVFMALYGVFQEQQYKLREKYAPQSTEEAEARAAQLIAYVLEVHDQRRIAEQELKMMRDRPEAYKRPPPPWER